VMRCHARMGHRDLALRQYERCVRTLQQELDTIPDAETVALRDSIERGGLPVTESVARR